VTAQPVMTTADLAAERDRRQGDRRQEQSVGLLAIADRLDGFPELAYEAEVLRRIANDRRQADRRT